ncbi:MAG: (2Fe-2S)-binding protein, partial [Calditrichia bacterium]|nr:(2Fe-2S)-binding protein [Calditrichia bacterium]
TLNGKQVSLTTKANRRLLDVLRNELSLTGTKEGCGVGECGACTVMVNGEAVNSCLVLIPQVEGAEVLTVEGMEKEGKLHSLQENFLKEGAVQCGYCTPGMLMSSYALLQQTPNSSEEEIKTAIEGNLCRCTGYKQIIKAVKLSAKEL